MLKKSIKLKNGEWLSINDIYNEEFEISVEDRVHEVNGILSKEQLVRFLKEVLNELE